VNSEKPLSVERKSKADPMRIQSIVALIAAICSVRVSKKKEREEEEEEDMKKWEKERGSGGGRKKGKGEWNGRMERRNEGE